MTVELPWGSRPPMMPLWVEKDREGLRFLGPIVPGRTVMRSADKRVAIARRYASKRHDGVQIETEDAVLGCFFTTTSPVNGAALWALEDAGFAPCWRADRCGTPVA